jgi:hypothetical protein
MAENPLRKLWDSLCDRAWAEGRVIRGAPTAFALGVLLSGAALSGIVWKIIDTLYSERIAVQESTIQNLESRPNPAIPQQAANSARHLLPQQGSRLAAKLGAEQDEHFMIEFNSVQNCDECEEYAQELRDFLNAIRGFKSGGGVIAFSVDTKYRQGLHLIVSEEYAATLTDRILSAFDAADIPLLLGDPEKLYGDTNAIVVVGRRAK